MQAMNSLDQLQPVEGMGPVGEVRLVPDPETFTVLPYAPHSAVMLVDHLRLDGQPYEAGPRNFLKRMAARLAERGMVLSCAVENEWSLATQRDGRHVPVDESLCFSTVGMAASAEVTDATVVALGEQGIQVEQYYAELGHGQQELSVAPRPAVQAADTQILVRETIRGVSAWWRLLPPSRGRTRLVTGRTSTSACGTARATGTCSTTPRAGSGCRGRRSSSSPAC